ncbi:MAG: cytochrome c-type biogenesis protein [Gammaproteobacteria bacterium]|nr:cytochrome c-type biogenesis protein [Gammaproteobacteria bacterium]
MRINQWILAFAGMTVIFIFFFSSSLFAAQDIYSFDTQSDSTRFQNLTTELRCLVCQNQNLAESNAPLAADLRQEIYQKMRLGDSNQQIIDYLTARYGDFILYRPPFRVSTLFLWLGPLLFILIASFCLVKAIRHNSSEKKTC